MIALEDSAVPFLPRGVRLRHCDIRKGWFLLAPERAVKLDQVGSHILQAVDGNRSFAEVVAHLAAQFNAPPEQIATDARKFLVDLMSRRMVETRQ